MDGMGRIGEHHEKIVLEDPLRFFKSDAVPFEFAGSLVRIPLESHGAIIGLESPQREEGRIAGREVLPCEETPRRPRGLRTFSLCDGDVSTDTSP